ncbi:MAG: DUF1573 domain-containing protein [Planctomycetota bacterium]|nr:MAG: DUF1573 domain-containing protein [Planctomycetota bacterium]
MPGQILATLLAPLVLGLAVGSCGGGAEAPGLRFETRVADLGHLLSGSERTIRFPFGVGPGEPVRIDRLVPGCGCLRPRLERDGRPLDLPAVLAPGEQAEVVVEYHTAGFQGRKDTPVRVEGSGPGLPAELEVRSLLDPWLILDPPRWTPGSLTGDGPWETEIEVSGPEPFRLLAPTGLPAGVAVAGLPSAAPARRHLLRLRIGPETAPGDHAWFLKLRADNGLSTVLPVQYRREEGVWTRPARVVRLGNVPTGTELFATVEVGAEEGSLKILESRVEGIPGARVETLNLRPSRTYRLRLAIPTGAAAGVLAGRLVLRLEHTEPDGSAKVLDRTLTLAGVVQ